MAYQIRQKQRSLYSHLRERTNGYASFEVAPDDSVASIFERVSASNVDKPAIVYDGVPVSYGTLQALANGVAALLGKNAAPHVVLLIDNPFFFAAAVLGALKIKATYIPLDPAFPEMRNARIVECLGEVVVLTESHLTGLAEKLLASHGGSVALIEDAQHCIDSPSRTIRGEEGGCIIFTSGSTGKPKGVVQPERNLLQLVVRYTKSLCLVPDDHISFLSSPSVTASIAPLFSSLLTGATLFPFAVKKHGLAELADWLDANAISVYHSVPSLFRHLLQSLAPGRILSSIDVVRLGGDSVYKTDVDLFLQHLPASTMLVNSYGCSEMSTVCCYYFNAGSELDNEVVPIGFALDGVEISLSAQEGVTPDKASKNLSPDSADFGEIVIKSRFLALKYLDGSELRRCEDSCGTAAYFTGDYAENMGSEGLVHIGRIDRQIKLSGFRIELAEIEACIRRHADTLDVAVILQTDKQERPRLMAYVAVRDFADCDGLADRLRSFVADQMPANMVPAIFNLLESLPLTPNGKIDKGALASGVYDSDRRDDIHHPVLDEERYVSSVWSRLLRQEVDDIEVNFFWLGGDSLLALRVINEIRPYLDQAYGLKDFFESPTIRAMARFIDLSKKGDLPIGDEASRNTGSSLPMSYAQQRLWFLSRLDGASRAYHMSFDAELRGQLDETALARALNRIVQRHAVLRTTFELVDGEPCQRIGEQASFFLQRIDLRGASDIDAALQMQKEEEVNAAFDLEHGPVIRGRLLRQADTTYTLLVTMHHIASDGWSMGIFFGELRALYAAFAQGQDDPLPALPVQYADYAVWQRTAATAERVEAQLQYWERQLAGAPTVLALPWDRPRPAQQDYAGALIPVALDATLSQRLKALSQREGTTLFMTMLAAWMAVLARLAREEDVVVGTVMANRGHTQIEGLIGFFVNTLAMRVQTDGALTVRELLARVKACALEAQQHQDIPFEQMVERVQPERSLAHSPIFQTMFVWQNNENVALELPGIDLQVARRANHAVSRFDLTLAMGESAAGITGSMEYATALFDASTVQRMGAYLCTMLTAMVDDAGQAIGAIDLLPASEREQVLHGWNQTALPYPADQCIHQLFEQQVVRAPAATAVVFDTQTRTYAELNAGANRLAHELIARGVRPGDRLALCVERSIAMVEGILAILKAGGVYVPLDPAYPSARLMQILSDATPTLVLTDAVGRDALGAALNDRVTLAMDEADPSWRDRSTGNPDPHPLGLGASDLAYLIYTSGSTGLPKGVMVEHRNAVNLAQEQERLFTVTARSRVMQFASLNFDASIWEVLMTLSVGAALHVPLDAQRQGDRLGAYLAQEGITHVALPPALVSGLGTPDALHTIEALILAGESPDPAWIRRLRDRGIAVFNAYGVTEGTVCATVWSCPEGFEGAVVPIGRPIANTQIYLLDERRQPVPMGVAGEMYIGGAGVARGYLNQPELTAERFLPDPFSADAMARMYKTGDLARYLPDGDLQFLGRNDHQIKIRGFRIEPGEIEARLRDHAAVQEAVVVVREEVPGDKRLVAYWVAAETAESVGLGELTAMLRGHLVSCLPNYMVPAAFVNLNALPLTHNGKLDVQALPAPDDDAYARQSYVPPQGEIEQTLAALWEELLGVERVGRHDNFFELGGHSLLAVRVVSTVRERFAVALEVRDLFSRPLLKDLAQVVEAAETLRQQRIPIANRSGSLPMSFAQQRLWFLAHMDGASDAYHVPFGMRLQGALDRTVLRRALNRIVRRHEALRTTFGLLDGVPVQRIVPAEQAYFTLREDDVRQYADPEAECDRRLAEEVGVAFDLDNGPVIRGRLIQHADEAHTLLVIMHHIAADGWSIGVFLRELSVLYSIFLHDREDALPALTVQYADYSSWQRAWMDGEVLQRQAAYWRNTLAGAPALLELPTDRPRPLQQDYRGAVVPVVLDEKLTAALKILSRRHGTTLFMTLMAGWSALLSRLSRQEDVVIGTPVANRGNADIEGLIGFFVNTLAMRVEVSGALTVRDLLARVKASALEAQRYQDIPFEQIVELVNPVRNVSHTPLFQVMFAWQNAARGELQLPGMEVTVRTSAPRTVAKFDLTLSLREAGDTIVGNLEYATALFDPARIVRFTEYFRLLLEAMVADASQPVTAIDILPPSERTLLLETWNATQAPYANDACIHDLFEAQVMRTPEAIALVGDHETVSYAELNARANRLAHYLIALGVQPDDRIAICVDRSVAMVVGQLGILKAGGAYVPLDPAYPSERLHQIVADAAPSIVLTDAAGRSVLSEADLAGRTALRLDDAAPVWAATAASNPVVTSLQARHLAYVIYTSGSTGTPKGVMIEHAQVVRLFETTHADYGFDAQDTWCLFHSFAFDFSVWELWGALRYGGRVVIVPYAVTRSSQDFYRLVCEQGITVLNQTPSAFQAFSDAQKRSPLTHRLRYVIFGGEALEPTALRAWYARHDDRQPQLVNMYGITETTVHTTYRPMRESDSRQTGSPIGRRLSDLRVYILDTHARPVPLGVIGELYIGGAGLARGYLNRPELTAERFPADPFVSTVGARMYKTGDLARYRSDGQLEYLGRNDQQVKIRGFRIELGEIEARLIEHATVREAVVLAREDVPGDKRLVAYVVGEEAEAASLRTHLQSCLPEYMVPSAFVVLEALPLTPNGKLDRKALPTPDDSSYVHRVYEAPQGEIEEGLAAIWANLLKLEQVGRHDHFFERGGHSLLAIRVATAARERFAMALEVRDLFSHPQLKDLAQVIQGAEVSQQQQIVAVDTTDPLPLSYAQQRLWFLSRLDGGSRVYHMPFGVELHGQLDEVALGRALDRIVARHAVLRTTFELVEGEPRQRIHAHASFAWQRIDLRGEADIEAAIRRQKNDEVNAAFDLEHGPVIRGRLLRQGDTAYTLLVTMHHIASDGWSMGIFFGELRALYAAFAQGQDDPLPALPVQYADYAVWQRTAATAERVEAQLQYWERQLAGAPTVLALPWDRPRPAQQDYAGAIVPVALDAALSQRLKALSQREGTTLFMTMLAAWMAVLARLAREEDVVVGTVMANRGHTQIEGLIGFFVNTLAMRVQTDGALTVRELLARVKACALEAQQHQDIPFEQMVERVQPERSLAHSPIFQVMFAWQNNEGTTLALPGVEVRAATHAEHVVSRFDLTLSLGEKAGAIMGMLEYATALFDASTVQRMGVYLTTMLTAMVDDAGQAIGAIDLLSTTERVQVLAGWSEASRAQAETTVAEAFARAPVHTAEVLAATQIYLLDERAQPVPPGVVGEVYIGGAAVTRDHRAQPSLHTERLLADPFSTQAHAWMYRTGELGVRKDGGVLVYAGTLEERAKRRQFKVRQRELETLLKTHPDLADAVVTVWGDPDESAGLTAYVVPQAFEPTQTSAQEKALRRYLRQQPSMPLMPTAIVTLERLPLMANGKVDRRALPIPEGDAYAGLMYEAPQGEIEEGLAAIWASLLKLERVGRHDHFFERGGHSLLGVRVISAIRERFAVALEVRDLFSHPQLRDLAQVIQGAEVSQQQPIAASDHHDLLPLSYAQQRLWFLSRLEGGSRVYHMPFGVELHGALDEAALVRALDRIVERHAVLRTTFELVNGEPRQRIHAAAPFALQRIDLRGKPNIDAALKAQKNDEVNEAFDLERDPVIRGRLLRQGDTAYTLLVTMHHIASDGWSMGIFFGELRALYAAFAQGQDDPLPALPVQYADYAVWQRTAATAERVEAQLQYWEQQLAGAPTVLELPWDRPRPAQQDYAGAIVPVALDAALSQRLKALSQREGTTLFMTMLAAWMAVLARLAREEDVVVGTVMANRGHTQIEGLIGFFVNTLAMRVQTDGALTVRELLARVKACALEAQQHQDIPFEQMVERVQPERSLAHSPIFQVMFAWQNNENVALELPGIALQVAQRADHTVSRFDLTLAMSETAQGIAGVLEYATALFDASTVQRMGAYLCTMLTAMVDDAGQAIGAIDLLSSSEREQVLHGWNATERAMAEGTLTDGFEQQVQRTPEAIAIREDAQTLSYRDLDARANQVAQRLIAEGVRAGQVVAVALPRSIDLVVVFLGVLKAGAVYLSLDPENPPERQAFLLADARPVRLITRRTLWSVWPEGDTGWDWTEQAPRCAQASSARPARDSDAMDAAYIIYTSGSTGTPKGVVVPHQAVVRVVQDNGFATLHSDDRMAFACNPTFDVSMLEIWAPLLAGACIVVVAQDTLLAPERLKAWLTEARVTAMWLTVGLFNQYAEALMEVFARLRYLLVGGDALDPRTIERVLQQGRPQHLLNGYGPTEATILATTHRIEEVIGGRSIPIGRPVANTRMYVLDERRQPVPVGVLGELYIGGKAVALGYWNREALTAERFVADPFSPHADARMYKTGDLGRWLPDGTLEYGGRNDFQVKVRGYRIELGEIEARLHEHEAVHETVVIARADSADEKRLVAYWVPAPGTRSDGEDKAALLRAHLGTRLPAYMVPSAYVMLEALPLTRNGKIDRRALPVPDGEAYAGMVYEAPQGEVEETLAQIWSDLLKVEQVGRHDHFFHLGGHSLLAVRVISSIALRFDLELAVYDMFSTPVLRDFAEQIELALLERFDADDLLDAVQTMGTE